MVLRKIFLISLFPDALAAYLKVGMLAKAVASGHVAYHLINLRDFGIGSRRQVDDTPYGGGDGMILRIEPLVAALEFAKSQTSKSQVILLTPRGHRFQQATAQTLADSQADLILVGGRYTGYDERLTHFIDLPISIGDYVLTGSELPALVVVDAVVRLLEGVLGGDSRVLESFTNQDDQVGYPQYTKPANFRDLAVPEILTTGNHQQIAAWRRSQIDNFKL